MLGVGFMASVALADSFEGSVVAQMRGQGYREINVETTMLGRVRIVGAKGGGTREIILNPRTGEILRDVVLAEDGRVEPQISGDDGSGKGSSGSGSSGDDGSGEDGSDDSGSGEGDSGGEDAGDDSGGEDKGDDGKDGSGKGGSGKDGGGESEN